MSNLRTIVIAGSLSLIALACAAPPPSSSGAPSEAASANEPTRIEGWWEMGDSAGPFTAELDGEDIVSIERELSHGEYGSTRDRFDFESDRLVLYNQDSELRLMDPDDPSRLVPVSMRLGFGKSGELTGGEKTIDGATRDVETADVERVRVQVEPLIEQARSFAEFYAAGGKSVKFACADNQTFTVTIAGDTALLDLNLEPGCGLYFLSRQGAASGAKFGDEVFVFWNKGDEALVDRFGQPYLRDCSVVD